MPYVLTPPTVRETPAGFGRLFSRYPIHRGDSLLVYGELVVRTRTPSVQETLDADFCFLGGHVYEISEGQKTILTNAGFGDNITTV